MFDDIIDKFKHDTSAYRNATIKTAVMSLLVHIAKNHSNIQAEKGIGHKNEGVLLALGFLSAHINEKISIETLAVQAGLSKYYFIREFKKATGETPVVFINKMRCENAKKLLSRNLFSINEISERCGFENTSYFTKTFKKYTGITPREYLKKQSDNLKA